MTTTEAKELTLADLFDRRQKGDQVAGLVDDDHYRNEVAIVRASQDLGDYAEAWFPHLAPIAKKLPREAAETMLLLALASIRGIITGELVIATKIEPQADQPGPDFVKACRSVFSSRAFSIPGAAALIAQELGQKRGIERFRDMDHVVERVRDFVITFDHPDLVMIPGTDARADKYFLKKREE